MVFKFFEKIRTHMENLNQKRPLTRKFVNEQTGEIHKNLSQIESHVRSVNPQEKLSDFLHREFGIQHLPEAKITLSSGVIGSKKVSIDPHQDPESAYSLLHAEKIRKGKLSFFEVFNRPYASTLLDHHGQNIEAIRLYLKMATGVTPERIEFGNGEVKTLSKRTKTSDGLDETEAIRLRKSIESELAKGRRFDQLTILGGGPKKKTSAWKMITALGLGTLALFGFGTLRQAQIPNVPTPAAHTRVHVSPLAEAAKKAVEKYKLPHDYGVDFQLLTHLWLERKQEVDPKFKEKHAKGTADEFMKAVQTNLLDLEEKGIVRHTNASKDKAETSRTLNAVLKSLGLEESERLDQERHLIEAKYKAHKGWVSPVER